MSLEKIELTMFEGVCSVRVFTTPGQARFPAVILYMDAYGIRQAFFDMAERIADRGYLVLVPDLYYRYGRYAPLDPFMPLGASVKKLLASNDNLRATEDTEALIRYIKTRRDYNGKGIGVVGFSTGGSMALTAAALLAEDIKAAACFYADSLMSSGMTSPLRYIGKLKADTYIAFAGHDERWPAESVAVLESVMREHRISFRSEIYPSTLQGFMLSDTPGYDPSAAENGWHALNTLLTQAFRAEPFPK